MCYYIVVIKDFNHNQGVLTEIQNLTKSCWAYCILGQRCHPWPIHLAASHWRRGVDLADMLCFSPLYGYCLPAHVYLWVTHCGQTPAHRLLVWLMNQCLQGVFEEVYCAPLFYTLKHPVPCLPVHTKEKINPPLTLPQWMARATVPSTISCSSEQKERRIMDRGKEHLFPIDSS